MRKYELHYLSTKGVLRNLKPEPAGAQHVEPRAADESDEANFMKICKKNKIHIIP